MYFLKRILSFLPLLVVITFLAFALAHAMPGSPFAKERAPASPEIERALRAKRNCLERRTGRDLQRAARNNHEGIRQRHG